MWYYTGKMTFHKHLSVMINVHPGPHLIRLFLIWLLHIHLRWIIDANSQLFVATCSSIRVHKERACRLTGIIFLPPFFSPWILSTVFENCPKSCIQNYERSELRLHFKWKKFIKNAKNGPFWRVFDNLKLAVKHCYLFNRTKIGGNAKIEKLQMRHFEWPKVH